MTLVSFPRRWRLVVAGIAFTVAAVEPAAAQARRSGPDTSGANVSVDVKIGSETIAASGAGQCTHAPVASIYNVRSKLWSVRQGTGGKPVQLSLWRPADGSPDMFSLSVGSSTVSTVKGGQPAGSGTVTLEPSGNGGTFRIDAKSPDGRSIAGWIKCDQFTPHVAEGG